MIPSVKQIESAFRRVQDTITTFLTNVGDAPYHEDEWHYERGTGGGITRPLSLSEFCSVTGVTLATGGVAVATTEFVETGAASVSGAFCTLDGFEVLAVTAGARRVAKKIMPINTTAPNPPAA